MVLMINHSLFKNINNKIVKVIIEIGKAIELDIVIFLLSKYIVFINLFLLSYILPFIFIFAFFGL